MIGTCPVAHEVDLFAPSFHAQIYDILGRLRDDTPVAYLPEHDLYIVTRYQDVERIFNDVENFSALNASSPILPLAPEAARILRENVPRKPALTNADPPRHTAMRAAVAACLGAPRWRKLQPPVRAYAEEAGGRSSCKSRSPTWSPILHFRCPPSPASRCSAFRWPTASSSRNGAAIACCCPMAASAPRRRSTRHTAWWRSGATWRRSSRGDRRNRATTLPPTCSPWPTHILTNSATRTFRPWCSPSRSPATKPPPAASATRFINC